MLDARLDERLHAYDGAGRRAEVALRGQVGEADWTWVTPLPWVVGPARLSLRAAPDVGAAQVSEALPGEALQRLWEEGEWVRVRTVADGYLGWAMRSALEQGQTELSKPLTVTTLRAHAFAGPTVSQSIVAELCYGARVEPGGGEVVTEQRRRWRPVTLPGGAAAWVQEVCFAPIEGDLLTFARRFLETPYVWGGRSAWGLDCSGLTELVYGAFGRPLPRDADQQQAALKAVDTPQPGDLAFFPGHVGLMLDGRRMLHANATHMKVTVETLGEGDYGQRLAQGCTGYGRWPG